MLMWIAKFNLLTTLSVFVLIIDLMCYCEL